LNFNLAKLIAWYYDNGWGYSCRVCDFIKYRDITEKDKAAGVLKVEILNERGC
jgi:hypothetical protein